MKAELREITHCSYRIWTALRENQRQSLVMALGLMALTGALTNVPPVILGRLLDQFVEHSQVRFADALPALAIILLSILIREGIQVYRRYLVENTCTRVEKSVRVKAMAHLFHLDLSFLYEQLTGSLQGRLNRSLEGVVKLLKLCFLDFFPSAFIALFALGVVFYRAPQLGLMMALVIPIGFGIVLWQIGTQKGIRLELLRGKEKIDGTVVELLGGLENVRAMNTEGYEVAKVEQIAEQLRQTEITHHLWMAGFDAGKSVNEGVFHVLVLALSIGLAASQRISTGDILTYSMLFLSVVTPLREIHRILDEAHESSLRSQDLFALMDLPQDGSFKPVLTFSATNSVSIQPAVKVSDLWFTYTGMEQPAIKGLDLTIDKGEYIGLCGAAGCGKSTLLKALLRLIHPQRGTISLFGQNLDSLTRKELALKVGYVSQNPFLFSGTVFENIAYGMEGIDLEQVKAAASKANIHQEIIAMPDGYDSQVGERGTKLSGGQRQRIALARVFLRSPSLLILDEATAALDNLNEKVVQEAIEEAMAGRTVIAVAHRLTTLKNADRILVFDQGQVVESGTYQSLLLANGLFSRLAKASNPEEKQYQLL